MDDVLSQITPEVLLKAAHECSRGVMWKSSVSMWMFNSILNCSKLNESLHNGTYKLSKYVVFEIHYKKTRRIHSTKFIDRVVQRALCDVYLYDAIAKPLIYETGACLKRKGITFMLDIVRRHLHNYYFSHGKRSNSGWYVKIDVKKFFDSTPHCVLKAVAAKHIKDAWARSRVFEIIDSFEDCRPAQCIAEDPFGTRGAVLGSQISQLLQVLVLNDLDHVMKQKHKVNHYFRYMDDMLMLVETRDEAVKLLHTAEECLSRIGLSMNKKSRIGRIQDGFEFLNVNFKLSHSGEVRMKLSRKTVGRELHRLNSLVHKLKSSSLPLNDFMQHLNSWYGSNMHKMTRSQLRAVRRRCIDALQS